MEAKGLRGGERSAQRMKEAREDSLIALGVMSLVENHQRDLVHPDEAVSERVEEKLSRENEAAVRRRGSAI